MTLFITGDIALPRLKDIPNFESVKNLIGDNIIISNLEGSIIEDKFVNDYLKKNILFNTNSCIDEITKILNIRYLNISNNHIFDFNNSLSKSADFFRKKNITLIGNKKEFQKIISKKKHILINSYGWQGINCKNSRIEKINLFDANEIFNSIINNKKVNPETSLLLYFHWGYELEKLPAPFFRKFAHKCIDLGADLIVGCHSHCIQGYEIYKNKTIVYGLGNFLYPQSVYFDGKLSYDNFSKYLLIYEHGKNNKLHLFKESNNKLESVYSEKISQFKHKKVPNFSDMSYNSFDKLYAKNRRNSFLLPKIGQKDSLLVFNLKTNWLVIRHKLIIFLKKII